MAFSYEPYWVQAELPLGFVERSNMFIARKTRLLVLFFGGILTVLLLWLAPTILGRGPSALVVQVVGDYEQVQITSDSPHLRPPLLFTTPGKEIRVESIDYGPYVLAIRYRDRQTLFLECFHIDAGKAKTIRVTVTRQADGAQMAVKSICTYRGQSSTVDFSDEVVLEQTSEKAPCRIWGGP